MIAKPRRDNRFNELSLFFAVFGVLTGFTVLYVLLYKTILGAEDSWTGFFYAGTASTDTFMDFFNPLQFSLGENPYDNVQLGAIYPPLCYMLYALAGRFIPNAQLLGGSGNIRADVQGMLLYFGVTIALLVFLAILLTVKLQASRTVRFLLALTAVLSFPVLYLTERGNILLFVLVLLAFFVFYKDDERPLYRELALLALAVAAAIKMYPAVFGLLLFFSKNKKGKVDWLRIFRCVVYGVLIFVLPFFYYDGIETIRQFIANLTNGMQVTTLSESSPYVRMDMGAVICTFGTFADYNDVTPIANACTAIVTLFSVIGIFKFAQGWKKALCCAVICMVVPSFGYTYCLAMLLVPVYMMLVDRESCRFKYLYTCLFAVLLVPVSFMNNAVKANLLLAAIYVVLILDVILDFFHINLSIEGRLQMKSKQNRSLLQLMTAHVDNLFFAVIGLNFILLLVQFLIIGRQDVLASQYLSVGGNYFGDFFESIFFSVKEDLYSYGNIYPPFCYLILELLAKLYPNAAQYGDPFSMRDTQVGRMLYITVVALCILVMAFCILKAAKAKPMKKLLTLGSVLVSLPLFVLIDRGNLLLIALAFSFVYILFYDSKNKVLRELALLSLAIAAAIKIYPAVLGLLLVKRGNIKVILRTVLYGVVFFCVPFLFYGGLDGALAFVQNLQAGVDQRQLVEGSINCQVNFSSVTATIYRFFYHHPSDAQYAAIESVSRYLSYVFAAQFILGSFLTKQRWKKVLALSAIILLIPGFSYSYCIASYLPAVLLYITEPGARRKSDLLYLLPLACLIIPYGITLYDFFFSLLEAGTRYTVVCQNLAQAVIFVLLFVEFLVLEIRFLKNDGIRIFIRWSWGFVREAMELCRELFEKVTKKKIDEEKWLGLVQFVKFGFVGFSNTVISTLIYWVMIYFNCNKYVASITGFVVSVLNSFFWNNTFVFKKGKDEERNPFKALVKTFMSYALTGLVLHNILLWVWTELVGLNDYIVPIINLLITIPLNFVMNKFWAFKTKKEQQKKA